MKKRKRDREKERDRQKEVEGERDVYARSTAQQVLRALFVAAAATAFASYVSAKISRANMGLVAVVDCRP